MDVRTIFNGLLGMTIVVLGGCSDPAPPSSGVSPSSDVPPSSGVNNVTLGGTAAKGIISLGNVVAEELKTDGTVLAQVGSATTGADGRYSLSVSSAYLGGPIKVTVSADENTQMKCDVVEGCGARVDGLGDILNPTVVDFGEWYKPGDLNMMALVAEAAANHTVKVNITPYTDLAANYALATSHAGIASRTVDTGSLTSGGIYNANSEVSDLLNIDILNTQPVDITDISAVIGGDPTEVVYAAVSAAVLRSNETAGGTPNVNAALGDLSNSFNGGTIVTGDMQDILDSASSVLDQVGGIGNIADISGILAALQADIDAANGGNGGGSNGGGIIDPTPSGTADAADLVKVKAFVGDVRTWGTVIKNETGVNGGPFEIQTGLISAAADLSMDFLFGPAFFASAEVMEMHFHGRNTSPNLTDYTTGGATDPQFTTGTIAKLGNIITITDGVIDGVTVNMSMKFPADGEVLALGSSFSIEIVSASFESAATDVYINSGKVTFNLASEYTIDWVAIDQGNAVIPGILGGSVNWDTTMIQKQDDFGTPLDAEITFAGTLSTRFVNPSAVSGAADDLSEIIPGTLTINGDVSDTAGNKFGARFTFNIVDVELLAAAGMLDSAVPKIGLDFTMQLAGLPEVSVNINGSQTGLEEGTAKTTITYGGRRIVITSDLAVSSVDGVDNIAAIGDAAISNQDGVTMSFDGNLEALEGDVLFNNVSYATISKMDNGASKITYIDGTFEIL
ncbi:MAG: hypothetical protein L3J98_07845 [Gammaproteobacteria bacterium]|nr:hypothetical protein [Gammaproteobacteria bacterium]MCF6260060.1 hypothetical protein [Gammaproteobacteria bacterium]